MIDEHLSPEEQELLREQQNAAKLAANQLRDDIRYLMGTRSGRRIAWNLLSRAGIFHTNLAAEPISMARQEGRRSIGLELMAMLMQACPEQYGKMANENTQPPPTGNPTT